ncbi:TPA: ParB/RepB/Spo0J family partition protein [Pseudomonas aeruginosa]|nr:ParB/RepB/Spo0J family partition protein [Pseudomonas aeruginosa]
MYQTSLTQMTSLGINAVPVELRKIPIDLLHQGIWQQRTRFDEDGLLELADSLKAAGKNVVPIIVKPRAEGGYSIIAGERRWRAAQRVPLHELEALVGNYSHEQAMFIAAVENLQRKDLNPLDEARSYQTFITEMKLTHDEVAKQIGKSRPHVTSYLRLLSLDIRVRDAIETGRLTYGQARPLCSLGSLQTQRAICEKAIRLGWSVKRINEEVSKVLDKPKPIARLSDSDVDLRRLERAVSEATGLECVVKRSAQGQWQIGFNAGNSDSFQGLLERIGVVTDEAEAEQLDS